MTSFDWYRARIAVWTGRRDRAAARGVVFSRLRLVSFLGGVALLWWGIAHDQVIANAAGILSLIAFGWLVVVHARVLEELDRAEVARRINGHGIARLARDWGALPEVPAPPELDVDAHPYARDLDVFGHASLTKWLGRPATSQGASRLWQWLLVPVGPDDIQSRQSAVDDLASKREWREALAIEGQLTVISPGEPDRFLDWAESSERAVPGIMQAVAVLLPLTIWILLALFLTGVTDGAWWLIPLVAGIVVSYGFSRRMHAAFDRATLGERALHRYVTMLSLVSRESWTAHELLRLQALMLVGGEAPSLLAKLARMAGWSELRSGAPIFHFPIQALTLWDFHVVFALERWRARSGRHVRAWLDTLGSVDALATLSMVRADQPAWSMPRVDTALDTLKATALGHPLLPDDRRVANDVEVGPPGTILLITGSNMSGKSTLLRAIGLNAVMAQAGAPVCATMFEMPTADLQTSIRVQDSLELGLSYFMAALARLKQIVDAALRHGSGQAQRGPAPGRVLLYLLDEVLQGTNSVERGIAVRAVVRHLLDARAIGVMTTHDLALAGEEPLKPAARLAHFTEQVHPDGTMTFDYRLRPGLATSTNALRLMQLIGIPPQ
jgi:MutS-like protein